MYMLHGVGSIYIFGCNSHRYLRWTFEVEGNLPALKYAKHYRCEL